MNQDVSGFLAIREPPIDAEVPPSDPGPVDLSALTHPSRPAHPAPPWNQYELEVAIGLRLHTPRPGRMRLYLPRSRRYDYPEVKAWIKLHAPLHLRATLYLERR